jgi:small-conductance mechanosensitive channel
MTTATIFFSLFAVYFSFMEFLEYRFFSNPLSHWLTAFSLTLSAYALLTLIKRLVLRRLRILGTVHAAIAWNGAVLALLGKTRTFFLIAVSLFVGAQALNLSDKTGYILGKIAFVSFLLQLGIWTSATIRFFVESDVRAKAANDGARAQSVRVLGYLANFAVGLLLLLWCLDGFGVNITTLVAGLGVGGIAVALAVQNILGDLFASLTIVLDKPFVYGDFVTVGEFKGTIEQVGLKTTRVRSQSGEQVIFPNADLLQSRIRNFKRMQERRTVITFALSTESERERIRLLPQELQKIVEAQSKTRFERAHLFKIGSSGLEFEIVYWVLDPDYLLYMQIQQEIELAILEKLEKDGLIFQPSTSPPVAARV